jgi:hypothetical protein
METHRNFQNEYAITFEDTMGNWENHVQSISQYKYLKVESSSSSLRHKFGQIFLSLLPPDCACYFTTDFNNYGSNLNIIILDIIHHPVFYLKHE